MRTRYSFSIKMTESAEWARSEVGSRDLKAVVRRASEAMERFALTGFFPAVRIIKVDDADNQSS